MLTEQEWGRKQFAHQEEEDDEGPELDDLGHVDAVDRHPPLGRLEKAKEALRDSDEESEKSKRSSRLVLTLLGISWVTMTDAIL